MTVGLPNSAVINIGGKPAIAVDTLSDETSQPRRNGRMHQWKVKSQ